VCAPNLGERLGSRGFPGEETMKKIFLGAALFALALGGAAIAADMPSYVTNAVADSTRPKIDTDRDALRLPAQTLAFAGVKPGMVVGELFPGGGYFTRQLSDIVGPAGHIYSIENLKWDDGSDEKMAATRKNVSIQIDKFGDFTFPQKIDLFWITQNYHDLHIAKYGVVDMAAFNKHVYDSLKPGGIYFILDHQANPGTTLDQIAVLHRIEKAQVIAEVTAAGFKLVGEGDALHRATDDHTKPIFDKSVQGHTDQRAGRSYRERTVARVVDLARRGSEHQDRRHPRCLRAAISPAIGHARGRDGLCVVLGRRGLLHKTGTHGGEVNNLYSFPVCR
jgi:predicted methyltransferase